MTDSLYLVHHGIKGQKWGVRRFRNEDGTLTDAGKQRYKSDIDSGHRDASTGSLTKEGRKTINNTSENYNKAISGAQRITSGVRQATNTQTRNRYNKRENLTQEEMDSMSNEELRELVTRMNLEQQYSNLTSDNTARSKVQTGLSYAESALAIAGGVVSIVTALKLLNL